jgi:short-subunit dehydrogenase
LNSTTIGTTIYLSTIESYFIMSKLCLIVGFGAGVGTGIAKTFAQAGYNLSLIARKAYDATSLQTCLGLAADTTITISTYQADAANTEQLQAILAQSLTADGTPTVIIYNVVVPRFSLPSHLTPEALTADFNANVIGALTTVQAVLPALQQAQQGTILFTGGGWAHYPWAEASAISIGKAGLRSLALTLNEEFAQTPIRIGMLSIMGAVAEATAFSPDAIGQAFLARVHETDVPFKPEVLFTGK